MGGRQFHFQVGIWHHSGKQYTCAKSAGPDRCQAWQDKGPGSQEEGYTRSRQTKMGAHVRSQLQLHPKLSPHFRVRAGALSEGAESRPTS